MPKYTTLFSDFDRTLVWDSHKIPPKTEQAIGKLIEAGHVFSIVTGRAYQGVVEREVKRLGLKSLQIVRGGSEIIDPVKREVVWTKKISAASVKKIVEVLNAHEVVYAIEVDESIYTFVESPFVKNLGEGAPIVDIGEFQIQEVPKIVMFPEVEKPLAETIGSELEEALDDIHLAMIHKQDGYGFDINDQSAGKHLAVLKYLQLTQTGAEQVVGVGDSYNDYPLLSACGVKVAMGNAVDELKELADDIAPKSEDEGMVEVIRKYFGVKV